jgi:hypothetical protein
MPQTTMLVSRRTRSSSAIKQERFALGRELVQQLHVDVTAVSRLLRVSQRITWLRNLCWSAAVFCLTMQVKDAGSQCVPLGVLVKEQAVMP